LNCIDGYNDRMRDKDKLNLYLGEYISVAFNDPKHYPKKSLLEEFDEKKKNIATTAEERRRIARLKYGKTH